VSEIIAADIGGTHARFAIARVEKGRVASLEETCTFETAEHSSLDQAWKAYAERLGRPLPVAAAIALAAPIEGDLIRLTNNNWEIRTASLPSELGVERHLLINDFGAVGHSVAQLGGEHFRHLFGPEVSLPEEGVISIVGPGTGLGVAQLLRRDGSYDVIETEGGHTDFAPLDEVEDRILARLRQRHGRVSVERIASGRGLANIYATLAETEGQAPPHPEEEELWTTALEASDSLAEAAHRRFCLALGAVSLATSRSLRRPRPSSSPVASASASPATSPARASTVASSPRGGSNSECARFPSS
jgi:glucokinase